MKLKILVPAVLLIMGVFIWLLRPSNHDAPMSETPQTTPEATAMTQDRPSEKSEQRPLAPVTVSPSSVQASSEAPELKEGKVIARLAKGEVGYSQESAGVGIAGISFGQDGRPLIWDRYSDSFYTVDENGHKQLLYRMQDGDEYMKGATMNAYGDFVGLFGNTKLHLIKSNEQGDIERIDLPIEPDYLNAMRMKVEDDKTYLFAVDKSYLINADGSVSEFYGAPHGRDGGTLDIELGDDLRPIVTLRDSNNAPVSTRVEDISFGTIQGLYPMGEGRTVAIYESDPYSSDYNRENPYYTVKIYNDAGEVASQFNIPMGKGISIDQPIDVVGNRLIHSVQTADGLEVREYSLNP